MKKCEKIVDILNNIAVQSNSHSIRNSISGVEFFTVGMNIIFFFLFTP